MLHYVEVHPTMKKTLAAELITAREALRDKIRSLKEDVAESRIRTETAYSPITRPLKDIAAKIETVGLLSDSKPRLYPKAEKISKMDRFMDDISGIASKYEDEHFTQKPKIPLKPTRRKLITSTPEKKKVISTPTIPSFQVQEEIFEGQPGEVIDEEYLDSSDDTGALISYGKDRVERFKDELEEQLASPDVQAALEMFDPLPRRYIVGLTKDVTDEYDQVYGVRQTPEGFYIGVSPVEFDDKDILVGKFKYSGTTGLYDLLFKNNPGRFTIQDVRNYKDILQRSNAAYMNYIPEAGLTTEDESRKFQDIIKPIIEGDKPKVHWARYWPHPKKKTLGGALQKQVVPDALIEYEYWDDPNELVNRLRLLMASQAAGNSAHVNEITSIISELAEAKIIR